MTASIPVRYCTIYRGHGEIAAHDLPSDPLREPVRRPSRADDVELSEIMVRDLVCARSDLEIEAVIGLMIDNHLGCIPVVDDRRWPIGIVTKFDIVERLDASLRSDANGLPPVGFEVRTAEDVMMPIALTLEESATIADAASMMTCEDLHHVLVVSRVGALVGVVSTKDIVTWLVRNDGLMPFRDGCAR
jgi:CBS-domain-containing membrane protein